MLKIREAGVEDVLEIAKIKVETWRSAYKGLIPDHYLNQLDYNEQAQKFDGIISKRKDTFALVAEDDSKVVAFAVGGRERSSEYHYEGEVYSIYVREEFQKRGIGRHLMSWSAKKLKEMGIDSMMVWVLEGSPYRRFYETLNGKFIERMPFDLVDAELQLVGYGWKNIANTFNFCILDSEDNSKGA
ncbi:MAG: GNAT family N-acetyltransferase [Clostridia bacterium]|nr:GNAT family N-acetyltransferase [Clostridia bacterium]